MVINTIKIPIDFTRNLILGSKKFLDIITNEINKFYKDKCKSNELGGLLVFLVIKILILIY